MRSRFALAALFIVASIAMVGWRPSDETVEVQRIRMHFDSVLVELKARDVSMLSEQQRTARAAVTVTLAGYRNRGIFPHNYDFASPTPYFIDRKTGTLCAVAYLLESTGRRDIVDRVAAANNNVWVPQLKGDAQFEAWLNQNGLTLDEAARIQVPYMGEPIDPVAATRRENTFSAVGVAGSAAVASVATVNLLSNRDGHGRLRNILGIAAGVAGIGYGATMLRNDIAKPVAVANISVGVLSSVLSVSGIRAHRAVVAQQKAQAQRVAVAPLVSPGSGGVAVALRF